jgi:dCMP deaminase
VSVVLPATDVDLLRHAAHVAKGSRDIKTQNGAVLARPDNIVIGSRNGIPSGLELRVDRLHAPEKYVFTEHSERAVIYKAASMGWPTGGATMYALWFACPECARAIIAAGIYEVVGHVATRNATPVRWMDDVMQGEAMLREAGVGMRWLAEPLGVTIRFDGRELIL